MATEADVRRLAMALPEVVEKPSYGTPGFRVRDRLFARLRPEGDAIVVWCDSLEEKDALTRSDPSKFFSTPHYDGHPTVLVRLEALDDDELWEILADSWRNRAPDTLRDLKHARAGRDPTEGRTR
jgi:hypothetical protein